MGRFLPISGSPDSHWTYFGEPTFWQCVANLVPDNCPGAGWIRSVASPITTNLTFGLGSLASMPSACVVKLFGSSTGSGNVTADIYQGATHVFDTPIGLWFPSTAGEVDLSLSQIGSPSGLDNWSVVLNVFSAGSTDEIYIYGLEVDFNASGGGGGGGGPGGQAGANAAGFLMLMNQQGGNQ